EFLVSAGMDPLSIACYHHLGNDDFRRKEIVKSRVVDDMSSARRVPPKGKGKHADHIAVVKYLPAIAIGIPSTPSTSTSSLLHGGRSVINIFNECEDSPFATPLPLNLSTLAELLTRYHQVGQGSSSPLHSDMSLLSHMFKAPLITPGTSRSIPHCSFRFRMHTDEARSL
ncbi:hypothetical protein FA15DRAFT_593617, partial [Coprinopsis marcescibilis]